MKNGLDIFSNMTKRVRRLLSPANWVLATTGNGYAAKYMRDPVIRFGHHLYIWQRRNQELFIIHRLQEMFEAIVASYPQRTRATAGYVAARTAIAMILLIRVEKKILILSDDHWVIARAKDAGHASNKLLVVAMTKKVPKNATSAAK